MGRNYDRRKTLKRCAALVNRGNQHPLPRKFCQRHQPKLCLHLIASARWVALWRQSGGLAPNPVPCVGARLRGNSLVSGLSIEVNLNKLP